MTTKQQTCRIIVRGEVGPIGRSFFEGMNIRVVDGNTEVTGAIVDQSHLHGLIRGMEDMAIEILSMEVNEPEGDANQAS